MRWNIAPEVISLVTLGIIWVYSIKGSHIPTLKNRMFQGCLMVTFFAILTNILSTVMIYQPEIVPVWLTWIVTTIYFILTPLMGLVYFFYVISVIHSESGRLFRIMAIGSVPGIIYTAVVLTNPFHMYLFNFTMEQGYVRGRLIPLTYGVFYAYCIACLVMTLVNKSRMDRKIYRILTAFPILAVAVIIVQQIYPDIILSGSAATCAMLIIYLHLQNKQISMDYLTSVPNRHELLDMMGLMLEKQPEKEFTLIVVSLREFRQVNNVCGQQKGDQILKEVCDFLCLAGPKGSVYRFGGDEFALLFTDGGPDQIRQCVQDIRQRMSRPWRIDDYQFMLAVVAGIIRHTEKEETLENTIHYIEYAVRQAKGGKNGDVCYCDQAMKDKLERKRTIIQILKDKLEDKSFEMYYQPILSVETGEFLYAESLMRMNETSIGPVYPSEFIPIAEETGLIIDITYVILEKVCQFIHLLMEQKIPVKAIHVNFSGIQFSQQNLATRVVEVIENNRIPLHAVKIEFTESTLAESTQVVSAFAKEMNRHGIMIGLDDFGTGYSNFATVISIPFGTVKLDRSLICAAAKSRMSAIAVKNIVRTFKELGMRVIAEGVETVQQKDMMIDFGVDQIQGYYYAKPLSAEDMVTFMLLHTQEQTDHRLL